MGAFEQAESGGFVVGCGGHFWPLGGQTIAHSHHYLYERGEFALI